MNHTNEIKFWPFILTAILGSFTIVLSSSSLNIAIPYLAENLQTSLDIVKWTITGFMLAMGITAPLAAFIGERISYKKLYIISLTGFVTVSFLALFSDSIFMLIAIRIIQGLFGGMCIPATMSTIYQVLPKNKQVTAISLWTLAPTLAPAIGPTISGFLIQFFSWKAIFFINIPLGIIAIIMAAHYIPYYKMNNNPSFDFTGIFLSVLTSISLLFAFSEGPIWGWSSPLLLSLLVIGVITFMLFIMWELRVSSPMLKLQTFQYPLYTFSLICTTILNIVLYGCSLLTPIFLQKIQGLKPIDAAVILLPASILMAVIMPVIGKIYKKIGATPLIVAGILCSAIGFWNMSQLSADSSHTYVRVFMAVIYIGFSLSMVPSSNAGMIILPKELTGYGSSMNNWTKQLAASMAVGIFTSLLTTRASYHVKELSSSRIDLNNIKNTGFVMGINDVYFISFIIILTALPFSILLRKRKGKMI